MDLHKEPIKKTENSKSTFSYSFNIDRYSESQFENLTILFILFFNESPAFCHTTIYHETNFHDDNLPLRQFVTTKISHYNYLSLRQFFTAQHTASPLNLCDKGDLSQFHIIYVSQLPMLLTSAFQICQFFVNVEISKSTKFTHTVTTTRLM